MLIKLAEEEDRDQVAEQLSRINEQLAIKNRRARRIWKVIAVNIVWMALFLVV